MEKRWPRLYFMLWHIAFFVGLGIALVVGYFVVLAIFLFVGSRMSPMDCGFCR